MAQQPLVVIDTKTLNYARYVGRTKTDQVKSDIPLDEQMVEQFRVDPNSIYGEEEATDDVA